MSDHESTSPEGAGDPRPDGTGKLAVVAGDSLVTGRAGRAPVPWTVPPAPAASRGPAQARRGGRAPFGFVPLAAIGIAFLALPLVGLVARVPWRHLPEDLTAPGVLTALRLSLVCSLGAVALSVFSACPWPGCWRACSFRGARPWCAPWYAAAWCFRRWSAAWPCCSRSAGAAWSASRSYGAFGLTLPFTTAGAILAETFVAMPFFVITVEAGLRSMDRRLRGRGGDPRRRPLDDLPARHAAADRARRCWPAPSSPGRGRWASSAPPSPSPATCRARPRPCPLAVYLALQNNPDAAITLSLILLVICLAVLIALRDRWFPSR